MNTLPPAVWLLIIIVLALIALLLVGVRFDLDAEESFLRPF